MIHCDLDAFYASVEQRDNPELIGKPVIIGGSPQSRGVVSTCSYEARAYGVHSAMPTAQAHRLCPHGVFLPVNMKKYVQASQQVFAIFEDYTPLIEGLSIDEAFLDVAGSHSLFGSSEAIGRMIKERVKNEVGLNISIGISYNKFLAKLATNLGKPNGLFIIRHEETYDIMSPLPVSNLWGVGEKTGRRLNKLGIITIKDLLEFPRQLLLDKLGNAADDLLHLAQGLDHRQVETEREIQSLGRETTFSRDVSDSELLERNLLEFAQEIGKRLRRNGLAAQTVTIKLRFADFQTVTRRRTIEAPTSSDMEIYNVAVELFNKLDLNKTSVRLIGLSVSKLEKNSQRNDTLFTYDEKKETGIDRVMDSINERYGARSITRAGLLIKNENSN
ncbi:MAG: DNA polymerase IV [Candidatus Saccharibacteria bacterium]